jgi:hypothetical protein
MALFFFVAAVASGCRRLLADDVTAESYEGAPRNLEEIEMHFKAGDWAAHGVLLLEPDGDACASGTGGDATEGEFSGSWDVPEDGCYRVDAHSAGEKCGFSDPVALTIDWCQGRTETLRYQPGADGWTQLGVYPFNKGHHGGITQEEGAVDAFRVVRVKECEKDDAVFGALTIDTDAIEIPEDLAAQIFDKLRKSMGDAQTAFFHPALGRRLSAGEKAMNHVVVDFDTSALGRPFTPTEAAVKDATELICSMLDTVECGHAASFKLDESGSAKKIKPKSDSEKARDRARETHVWQAVTGIFIFSLVAMFGTCVLAQKCAEWNKPEQPTSKSVVVTPKENAEAEDEKKPQVEDDNVSTVTPASIPDSLGSMDDTKAEQQV